MSAQQTHNYRCYSEVFCGSFSRTLHMYDARRTWEALQAIGDYAAAALPWVATAPVLVSKHTRPSNSLLLHQQFAVRLQPTLIHAYHAVWLVLEIILVNVRRHAC